MQDSVYYGGKWPGRSCKIGICFGPGLAKEVKPLSLAFGARAMSGGKGGGFVEKEEVGVQAGLHDRVSSPLEFQQANDPAKTSKLSSYLSALVVQASAVAVKCSAGRGRDQCAERRDAILLWHFPFIFRACRCRPTNSY